MNSRGFRLLIVCLMGFSSGLPLALTGSTLQGWMKNAGVDLGAIGIFGLVAFPYSLKFLWAPIMDRFTPPILGRRRGWALITQVGLLASVWSLSKANPAESPILLATMALIVAFLSASQDIVIDAYRTEILKPDEWGIGSGLTQMGYRLAMLTSGGLAFILADQLAWNQVYEIMAALMGIGILATLLAREPENQQTPASLRDAVVLPFAEFLKRNHASEILVFILLYKMDAAFGVAMLTPFLLEMNFSKTEIGTVFKIFGLIATIAGTLAGGAWMMRLGMKRSLWVFGLLQGLAGLSLLALSLIGNSSPALVVAITTENFCSGLGNAAYAAFIMSLCDKRFTGTQFALLTSVMALTRLIANAPAGYIAKAVGWPTYFFISILLMIPALLVLRRYDSWMKAPQAS